MKFVDSPLQGEEKKNAGPTRGPADWEERGGIIIYEWHTSHDNITQLMSCVHGPNSRFEKKDVGCWIFIVSY
jgi:hypothetical protein